MDAAIARNMADVVVLQEVWHPTKDMLFHGYGKPMMKLREGKEGEV